MDRYTLSGELRRAYVVDDDEPFRQSLLMLLEAGGWVALGFASVAEFLAHAPYLQPGALLLDIRMPEVGGIELLESANPLLINFAIIIVTGHGDVENAVRSLKSGAVDFIEKPFDGPDLLKMLENSYSGLVRKISEAKREREAIEKISTLSPRESDVLAGLLSGASYKRIADHFGLSERTVEMYRNNLVRKLGAKATAEALHTAVLAKVEPAPIGRQRA